MMKMVIQATDIELLNQVLKNNFKEIDGTIENRNTYVEDGNLVRWVDVPNQQPNKVILRPCTEKESKMWDAYKQLVEALHYEDN